MLLHSTLWLLQVLQPNPTLPKTNTRGVKVSVNACLSLFWPEELFMKCGFKSRSPKNPEKLKSLCRNISQFDW